MSQCKKKICGTKSMLVVFMQYYFIFVFIIFFIVFFLYIYIKTSTWLFLHLLIQPWFSHKLFVQTLSSGSLSVFNGIPLPSHYVETKCVLERERRRACGTEEPFELFPSQWEIKQHGERERERESKLSLLQLDFSQTWVLEWISSDTLDVTAQLWSLCTEGIFKVLLTERVYVRRVCDRSVLRAMSGVTRKGSGRPGYYYRLLGRTRLQRQRSRSRSRSRATNNRGKHLVLTLLHCFWNISSHLLKSFYVLLMVQYILIIHITVTVHLSHLPAVC